MMQALLRAIVFGVGMELGREVYRAVKDMAKQRHSAKQPPPTTEQDGTEPDAVAAMAVATPEPAENASGENGGQDAEEESEKDETTTAAAADETSDETND